MAYPPSRSGPGPQQSYGNPAHGGPPGGYQYDDRGVSQPYGYGGGSGSGGGTMGGGGYGGGPGGDGGSYNGGYQNGGYQNGGYQNGGYQEDPQVYRGKARFVENDPSTQGRGFQGGYEDHGNGRSQMQTHDGGRSQGGYRTDGYQADSYGTNPQYDSRPAQQGGGPAAGYDQGYANQHQQRPPPQRPGHMPPRFASDRPPPVRQYTDQRRPETSGSSRSGGTGYSNDPQYSNPQNGQHARPHPQPNGPNARSPPNQPNSPQNMAWDNPFGSFGNVAGGAGEHSNPRSNEPTRPNTSHSAGHQPPNPRQDSDPMYTQQRSMRQVSHDEHPLPSREHNGHQYAASGGGQAQAPEQIGYLGAGSSAQPPANRQATPNFSRVQSPPIRNGQNASPNTAPPRSNTMPAELPFRGVNSATPTPSFQSDLPFREGRAQTPVYASPQYAEAQSAVIESVSDPPTATTADWSATSPDQDRSHPPSRGNQGHQSQHQQHYSQQGYNDTLDDYYGSQQSHDHNNQGGQGNGYATGDYYDMPDFDNGKAKDELHLDSGGGAASNQDGPPYGNDHGQQSGNGAYQGHGFDFTGNGQGGQHPNSYNNNLPNGQGTRAFSSPQQGPPPGRGGPGMPPGRGMPPNRGGGFPGRGGFPNPQDRSASAGPGPRPNGAPYGPPGSSGRGMPPPRGRGGPGGYQGDSRGGMSSGPGRGSSNGPRGRGGAPPNGGRGGPVGGPQPPAPVRPGLMQQTGNGERPPPVRQYTSPPSSAPPANQGPPPAPMNTTEPEIPVTTAELSRLKSIVTDNPGDQATTMTLVKKLVEASTVLVATGDPKMKTKNRERYVNEAYKLLKKLVSYNNPEAMFYMAECHGSGQLGLSKDPKEAFLLYQSAAKAGHAPSAYRVAVCCELGENEGGGTKRDPVKAMQWYRRAATLGDLPAMYKIGVILLKGLLGQNAQPGEAVNWLQRAADRADAENPHSLHELGLLYEAPPPAVSNNVFADPNYSYELFVRAANLGYKFSQYKLGQCFEYGQLNCPIDPRQSIAWYSKAAVQEEHQSELALSGWYLTGSDGVIQQSDTEAYLWARKAAQAGLAKAEYAMGYFTETGIGCSANLEDAKRWYWRASAQNFPKARERLEDLRKGGAKATQTRVSRNTMQRNQGECKPM